MQKFLSLNKNLAEVTIVKLQRIRFTGYHKIIRIVGTIIPNLGPWSGNHRGKQ